MDVCRVLLWYNELTATLENMGFSRNPYDTYSFSRAQDGSYDRILVYVDDLFLTSANESRLQAIADTLKSQYKAVTYETGLHHDFLGIHWDFSIPALSMDGYLNDIITKYQVTKQCKTPATDRLFHTLTDSPKLTANKRELFRSCVMTLYYLAKRIRLEILTAISYYATRILGPTEEDEKKLDGILSYLLFSRSNKMILHIGQNLHLKAFIDSSFGLYKDGKSLTGVAKDCHSQSLWEFPTPYRRCCGQGNTICKQDSKLALCGSSGSIPILPDSTTVHYPLYTTVCCIVVATYSLHIEVHPSF